MNSSKHRELPILCASVFNQTPNQNVNWNQNGKASSSPHPPLVHELQLCTLPCPRLWQFLLFFPVKMWIKIKSQGHRRGRCLRRWCSVSNRHLALSWPFCSSCCLFESKCELESKLKRHGHRCCRPYSKEEKSMSGAIPNAFRWKTALIATLSFEKPQFFR